MSKVRVVEPRRGQLREIARHPISDSIVEPSEAKLQDKVWKVKQYFC